MKQTIINNSWSRGRLGWVVGGDLVGSTCSCVRFGADPATIDTLYAYTTCEHCLGYGLMPIPLGDLK